MSTHWYGLTVVVYISPMSMQYYSNPLAPVHLPRTKSVLVTCGLFLALDVATSFRIADLGGRELRSETSKVMGGNSGRFLTPDTSTSVACSFSSEQSRSRRLLVYDL